jgi:hypothetical protein
MLVENSSDLGIPTRLFGVLWSKLPAKKTRGEINNDIVEKWDIFGSDRERAEMEDPYLEIGLREFENACTKASTPIHVISVLRAATGTTRSLFFRLLYLSLSIREQWLAFQEIIARSVFSPSSLFKLHFAFVGHQG